MEPMEFKVEKTGHKIAYEYVHVDGVFNVPIYDKDGKILGRAWLTQNLEAGNNGTDFKEKIILADIIVYEPEDRGKGVGDELMGFLTSSGAFRQIFTGLSTKSGRELCLKWGFTYRIVKHHKFLVWERKDENGKKMDSEGDQESGGVYEKGEGCGRDGERIQASGNEAGKQGFHEDQATGESSEDA
jgi:hypothetical protein